MEAQIQYCLYASKQECRHSPQKQVRGWSKLNGKNTTRFISKQDSPQQAVLRVLELFSRTSGALVDYGSLV